MAGGAKEKRREITKYWSDGGAGDLECLYAEYLTFSFAPHFHDAYAVGVIESGADVFDYRGTKQTAAAGDIMLINPLEVHDGHAADKSGWTFRIMYIKPELLRKVREEITGKSSDVPFFSQTVVRDDLLARQIARLHRALENSVSPLERECLFLSAMNDLLTRHADSRINNGKIGNENASVARVRNYLSANACQNITLDELARIAFLSPFHLLRVFSRKTGLPPHAYQTQIRIERARRLLLGGSTITQVALATGFFDQAHFSKQFKRYVGITPGRFLASNASRHKIRPDDRKFPEAR